MRFVLILAIVGSLWVSGMLEQQLHAWRGRRHQCARRAGQTVRALLLLIGIMVALSSVGIDLTVLSVFGGALGVGIGLGLQKLASNYIAGFTILLDRSIRIGDMITVDNRFGVVSKATARYVVRARPGRGRGDRPQRNDGDDDRAQSLIHQPRYSAGRARS